MRPAVSIITTLYNYKHFLPELAKSVADQTYTDWEWIIVDDASTDDPKEILDVLRGHSKIIVITHDENKGYSVAKNTAIKASTSDYLVMIDADDVLTPNSLMDRVKVLDENPDKLWVHADALNYEADGEIATTYIKWNEVNRRKLSEKHDLTKWYHHRLVHSQTVMVRREFHEILGLYDETLRFSSDNEMFRRAIIFEFIPYYLETPVAIYRVHRDRMSRSKFKRTRLAAVKEYIIEIVDRRFKEGITSSNTILLEKLLEKSLEKS